MSTTTESRPEQDVTQLARNMAELYDVSQKILQTYLETHPPEEAAKADPDPMNVVPAFTHLAEALMMRPAEIMDATIEFWSGQMAIWQAAMQKFMGTEAQAALPDLPKDSKRFAHPQWSENALYEYIKRSYYLASNWLEDVVDVGDDALDPKEAKKVNFMTRNWIEATNPANFFSLNPEVLEKTAEENGANLVRGAKMFLEDMQRGKGELLIRQTDMKAFQVGRDMAVTPGKVVWQNDILQLIQYAPSTETVHETPILFIPPWINKYYVLDLNRKKSMMQWLVAQGHTVFIVSWVNPDERHKNRTWEDYIFDGASACIDRVLEETGAKKTHVASYCIGGTLTGVMMAYLSRHKDKRVASTTFFTAQLDFSDAGDLQVFVDDQTIAAVDSEMDKGYLPAQSMAKAFNMLRANDLIWSYVVSNYLLGKEPFPFDLLYWNSDSTAMPAKVHHYYLETFYDRNAFAKGEVEVRGERLGIGDIEGKVYHIATVEDHIAPAASVYRGARQMVKADVTFVLSGSGHIAGVVNPPAAEKYQYWVGDDLTPSTLEAWKDQTEMVPGSWWPHWDDWLAKQSRRKVKGREPGTVLGVIEDAPGRYVCKRFDA